MMNRSPGTPMEKLPFSQPLILLHLLLCLVIVRGLENGLGRTPPMGWNSWNHFHCNIDEKTVRETANALVSTGLAKLGYKYVNVDDCWAELQRNEQGALQPRKETFPSGIKALADYVHSKGLKFGIYSDAGYLTCQKQPGSLNHEAQDAKSFASWGVDYLKYDNCNTDGSSPKTRYPKMRDALHATGRPIFFSICEWGVEDPAEWAQGVGNSWRTTGDIDDEWGSVLSIADKNNAWSSYASPGGWNDPDMLEVGNGGMSLQEYRAHFSLWAIMKAPLIIGCDVRTISHDYLNILNNTEVIQINQDSLGIQGKKVSTTGDYEIWSGLITGERRVMLVLNRGATGGTARFSLEVLGLPTNASVNMRDLWKHKDLPGTYKHNVEVYVASHDAAMFIVKSST